jgi:hypothetical protein
LLGFTESWNLSSIEMARNKNASITYAASKTEQERTAWNWVEENKPQFSFNAVLPNVNVSILFYFWR